MKIKGKTHYWVDVVIAAGFLLSVISGIVVFLIPGGGFQGGRNPAFGRDVLFVARDIWKGIHTWSSFAMAAGVLAHLVLHWNWITCMTRNLLSRRKRMSPEDVCVSNT